MSSAALILLILGVLSPGTRGIRAQTTACDSTVVIDGSDPWRYKERGARCEGRFLAPMSGPNLRIVGYYSGNRWRGLPRTDTLLVRWQPPSAPVNVRAVSLRWRTFYRMDTRQPSVSDRFPWPTAVLRNLAMAGDDIGVLASYYYRTHPRVASALVPVMIDNGDGGSDTVLSLVFVSDLDLERVSVEGVPLSGSRMVAFKPVVLTGPLVARRPFAVRLPKISPGLYDLFILAEGGYNVLTAEAVVVVPQQ
jgi:hypothetical protein